MFFWEKKRKEKPSPKTGGSPVGSGPANFRNTFPMKYKKTKI